MEGEEGIMDARPAGRTSHRLIGLYCVLMLVAYRLATIGVRSVAVQYLFKERFHLSPSQMAFYALVTDAPIFVGFLFGFLRDRVRPRGWGDRAYFLVAALAIGGLDLALGTGEATLMRIVLFVLALSGVTAFVGAAASGLLAAVSKEHGMTGRMSVASLVAGQGVAILGTGIGGWLDGRYGYRSAFVVSALLALPLLTLAFWRPRAVFRAGNEAFATVVPEGAGAALRRLLRHRAVFVPALVLFLWNFAPGWGTPLFFFLTNGPLKNGVGLTEAQYGSCQSVMGFGALAASLSYAWVCGRYRLRSLLIAGTIFGVVGCPIFLLIHGVATAYAVSFVAGLSCGLAVGAYYDVLSRSCPKELEGVTYMLTTSAYAIAGDVSDVFGSWLYERGGFGLALVMTTIIVSLILPVLALIPRSITAPPEGERLVDADPPRGESLPSAA